MQAVPGYWLGSSMNAIQSSRAQSLEPTPPWPAFGK